VSAVICGLPRPDGVPCPYDVERTHGPAGSLHCPDHGHVLDVFPTPRASGVVFLDYTDGHSEVVNLEDLR